MTQERQVRIFASREVRVIPRGWQHPLDDRGRPEPLFAEQMPDPGDDTAIVAYEATSEGTPISPAFPNTPEGRLELVRYCAEHCTTWAKHRSGPEGWAAILFGEGASVGLDGTVQA